jgi:hypothetical protein
VILSLIEFFGEVCFLNNCEMREIYKLWLF